MIDMTNPHLTSLLRIYLVAITIWEIGYLVESFGIMCSLIVQDHSQYKEYEICQDDQDYCQGEDEDDGMDDVCYECLALETLILCYLLDG